jgi:hypothetical protein
LCLGLLLLLMILPPVLQAASLESEHVKPATLQLAIYPNGNFYRPDNSNQACWVIAGPYSSWDSANNIRLQFINQGYSVSQTIFAAYGSIGGSYRPREYTFTLWYQCHGNEGCVRVVYHAIIGSPLVLLENC